MNGESKTKDILNLELSSVKNKHSNAIIQQHINKSEGPKPNLSNMVSDGSRQKKSLFQITRIVTNNSGPDKKLTEVVESMSDSNLPVHINGSVSTESIKSGISFPDRSIDSSDGSRLSSLNNKTSQQSAGNHDSSRLSHHADVQSSRFKVVRIASHRKPVIRGRWSCQDFEFDKPGQGNYISGPAAKSPKATLHQAGGSGDDKPASNDSGSEGSSLVNSIYYVQSGDEDPVNYFYNPCGMVYTNGHLTLDTILTDNHSSGYSSATVVQGSALLIEHPFDINDVYDFVGPDSGTNPLDSLTTEITGIPELSDPDACNGANSMCALDNKIEQAMDLVKSHLMFAVHEEVEQLKEQIKDLMIRRSMLEQENSILRASASPETLAKIKGMGVVTVPGTPETEYTLDNRSSPTNAAVLSS